MKKVSLFTCACACLLTAAVTLTCVFGFRRVPGRETPETVTADKLAEAAGIIRENYIGGVDETTLADGAISGMVYSLGDPWSYYMTAAEMDEYRERTGNRYGGIGIVVRDGEEGVEVAKVYARSPAGEAGVMAGSRILALGEESLEGITMNEAAEKIGDAIETGNVELRLLCPDGEERSYALTPGSVLTEPVSAQLLEGLGYIRIENFEDRSAQDAIQAVEDFRSQGVGGLIFDMRANPGGQLSELLELLDHLLPEGKLFSCRHIDGTEETETSGPECVELPMAVLVNEDTYSAAEFFAAALREYGWATLVGAPTSGKGRAQITVPMEDGSAIHISSVDYFTPQGNSLQGVGLTPDVEVPTTLEERRDVYYMLLPPSEDRQLQAAVLLLAGVPADSP